MVAFTFMYVVLVWLGLIGGYLWVWVSLEGSLLLVLWYIVQKGSRAASLFEYFIVQVVASLVLIGSVLVGGLLGLSLGLALNVGLFPFIGWVYRVVLGAKPIVGIFIVSGTQNIVPVWFWWEISVEGSVLLVLGLFTISLGVVQLLNANSLMWAIISSSLVHSGWLVILIGLGVQVWILYFMVYLVLLLLFSVGVGLSGHSGGVWIFIVISSLVPILGFVINVFTFIALGFAGWLFVLVLFMVGVVSLCGYIWPLVSQVLWEGVAVGLAYQGFLWASFIFCGFYLFLFILFV